jgi:membrane peptidoglycan carboxypeptidase
VNASIALRQPGSAIKPVTYAGAFSSLPGFTAAMPIIDVRTSFPTREGLPYVPQNYDNQHHGPISVRAALATSNNVAAVSVLQQLGLERMLGLANALGIHSFRNMDEYGLALTLGGGEVRLLELTAAYAAFANGGVRVDPFAVSRVMDTQGKVLYVRGAAEGLEQVLDPRVAWLITDILSDNAARASAFGQNSVLRLGRPAAVKTGTTTDWRDNWTVGYTPDLVTGVWAGNANNEPMVRISGVTGAGPIWHDFMEVAQRGRALRSFARPDGLVRVTVCALSGLLPSPDCPYTREEWFLKGTEPTQVDDWYRRQKIDTATGWPATASTPPDRVQERVVLALPPAAREWAREQGWPLYEQGSWGAGVQEREGDAALPCSSAPPLPGSRAPLLPCSPATITQPDAGSIYRISKQLPLEVQRIPVEVRVDDTQVQRVELLVDGEVVATFGPPGYAGFWSLSPGEHTFVARAYARDRTATDSAHVTVRVLE